MRCFLTKSPCKGQRRSVSRGQVMKYRTEFCKSSKQKYKPCESCLVSCLAGTKHFMFLCRNQTQLVMWSSLDMKTDETLGFSNVSLSECNYTKFRLYLNRYSINA